MKQVRGGDGVEVAVQEKGSRREIRRKIEDLMGGIIFAQIAMQIPGRKIILRIYLVLAAETSSLTMYKGTICWIYRSVTLKIYFLQNSNQF